MEFFPGGTPTREALDAVTSGRPAALLYRDHHGMWVNSRALELAGITQETADPVDGRIERDESGWPSGTLHEGASNAITALLPILSDELATHGLAMKDATDTYLDLLTAGDLTMRVVGAMWWERDGGGEQLE